MTHQFVNINPNAFDSNCAVCDGKQRDANHASASCPASNNLAAWESCGRLNTGVVCPCMTTGGDAQ